MKRTFWIGLAAWGFVGAAAAGPSHDMASMGCHGMQGMHDGGAAAGHAMPQRGGMGMMKGMMGPHGGMQGMHGGHGMNQQTPAPTEQDRTPERPRHSH